jgi:hypothetical protein
LLGKCEKVKKKREQSEITIKNGKENGLTVEVKVDENILLHHRMGKVSLLE